jgi:hypothetical protein
VWLPEVGGLAFVAGWQVPQVEPVVHSAVAAWQGLVMPLQVPDEPLAAYPFGVVSW